VSQPDCLGDLPARVLPFVIQEPVVDKNHAAIMFTIAFLIALAVFELWALSSGHHTISQWTQQMARAHRWLRIVGPIAIGVLVIHLFWSGPL